MASAVRRASTTAVPTVRYDAARNCRRRERSGVRGLRQPIDGLVPSTSERELRTPMKGETRHQDEKPPLPPPPVLKWAPLAGMFWGPYGAW